MLVATIFTMVGFIASALNHICFVEDLLSKTSAIRCGAERLVGMTKQRFIDRLTWLKCLLRFNLTNWHDRKNFERVSHTLEMLKLDDSNGSIRKQPYCVLLTGYPGCGKSHYALQIATACLKRKYGYAHPNDVVTLNETDEFQSEFRSSHKVVVFDDLGAERILPNTVNPWRKVIDFVNNIRKTSLNPNVEMKGNVFIEPDLVIITTNLAQSFDVSHFMNAPSAIYRRLKKIVYLQEGFEKAKLIRINRGSYLSNRVYTHCDVPMVMDEIIDREDLLKDIASDFQQHIDEQERFVNETNSNFDLVENKSIWQSFKDDVVYSILPKKVALPKYIEEQLPFYQRWYRSFCVVDSDMPVCMSTSSLDYSLESSKGTELVSYPTERFIATVLGTQNGDNDLDGVDIVPTNLFDQFVPQSEIAHELPIENHQGFIQDEHHELLIEFLSKRIDWDFFRVIRKKLAWESNLTIYEDRIVGRYDCFSWKHPEYMGSKYEAKGVECTVEDLDKAFERYKELSTETAKSDFDDHSTNPKVPSLVTEGKVDEHDESDSSEPRFSMWLQKDELFNDPWMSEFSCKIKRPLDNNMREVIETAPSSFALVAYEAKVGKYDVDLIFRFFGTRNRTYYVVVEVKSGTLLTTALNQANVYKQVLNSGRPEGTTVVCAAFNNSGMEFAVPKGSKKNKADVERLQYLLEVWKKNYNDRCGAVGLLDKKRSIEPKMRTLFNSYGLHDDAIDCVDI